MRIWVFMFLLWPAGLYAQVVTLRAGFIEDSIQSGKPVQYYLTARYPAGTILLLPDSATTLDGFQVLKVKYFPTETVNNVSYDSVVYTLRSFQVKDSLLLSTRIQLFQRGDTLIQTSPEAVIPYRYTSLQLPDSLGALESMLKPTANFATLPYKPNVEALLSLTALGILLLGAGWLAFGATITGLLKQRRLNARFRKFELELQRANQAFQADPGEKTAQQVNAVLRLGLEKIEGKPFTHWTTRELMDNAPDFRELETEFRLLDKFLYAPATNNAHLPDTMRILKFIREKKLTRKPHG